MTVINDKRTTFYFSELDMNIGFISRVVARAFWRNGASIATFNEREGL